MRDEGARWYRRAWHEIELCKNGGLLYRSAKIHGGKLTDFINTLVEMRGGAVASECNKKFSELIAAVLEVAGQKGGTFTLAIDVKPSKFGMGGVVLEVSLDADMKIKKPELPIGQSLFFVTQEGTLTKDDPKQTEMALFRHTEERTN